MPIIADQKTMDVLHRSEGRAVINCLMHDHRWVTFEGQPTICASCEITKEKWDAILVEMTRAAKIIEADYQHFLRTFEW